MLEAEDPRFIIRFLYIGYFAAWVGILGMMVGVIVGGEGALYVGWSVGVGAGVRFGWLRR